MPEHLRQRWSYARPSDRSYYVVVIAAGFRQMDLLVHDAGRTSGDLQRHRHPLTVVLDKELTAPYPALRFPNTVNYSSFGSLYC